MRRSKAEWRTRSLSRAKLARPYICRLISFSRWIYPSTMPLLHGSRSAASTAPRSRSSRRAKDANGECIAGLEPIWPCCGIVLADHLEEASGCMAERFQFRRSSIERLQIAMSVRVGFQHQPSHMLKA